MLKLCFSKGREGKAWLPNLFSPYAWKECASKKTKIVLTEAKIKVKDSELPNPPQSQWNTVLWLNLPPALQRENGTRLAKVEKYMFREQRAYGTHLKNSVPWLLGDAKYYHQVF